MCAPLGSGRNRWAAHFPKYLVSTPGTPAQEERVEILSHDRHLSVPRSDSMMLSP